MLNVIRCGLDGFVLVTLAFKKGPLQGVLFFIPPFTFYYLSQRGRVIKEALSRFLGAALPILGVLLLFIIVPWLRGGERKTGDLSIRDRLRNELGGVEENTETVDLPLQDSQN